VCLKENVVGEDDGHNDVIGEDVGGVVSGKFEKEVDKNNSTNNC